MKYINDLQKHPISPYWVRMWENADQNNSKYEHFLRSASKNQTIINWLVEHHVNFAPLFYFYDN